jgi:hypothetical protein
MEKTKTARKVKEWNPIGVRPKGHQKIDGKVKCYMI